MHARPRIALEARKVVVGERARDLSGTIGPEVEKYDGVVVTNRDGLLAVGHDGDGLDELVGHSRLIGSIHGFGSACRAPSLAACEEMVRARGSLPPLIPVHCPVAAHDGRDATEVDL